MRWYYLIREIDAVGMRIWTSIVSRKSAFVSWVLFWGVSLCWSENHVQLACIIDLLFFQTTLGWAFYVAISLEYPLVSWICLAYRAYVVQNLAVL